MAQIIELHPAKEAKRQRRFGARDGQVVDLASGHVVPPELAAETMARHVWLIEDLKDLGRRIERDRRSLPKIEDVAAKAAASTDQARSTSTPVNDRKQKRAAARKQALRNTILMAAHTFNAGTAAFHAWKGDLGLPLFALAAYVLILLWGSLIVDVPLWDRLVIALTAGVINGALASHLLHAFM